MRDPNRIDRFCDELKAIWHQVPDWRFGQLIVNIINKHNKIDPFYVEDTEFFKFMHEYLNEITGNRDNNE